MPFFTFEIIHFILYDCNFAFLISISISSQDLNFFTNKYICQCTKFINY